MIIVKLSGGLGNQMFQYALGRHLSIIFDLDLKLDIDTYFDVTNNEKRKYNLDIFNIEPQFATKDEVYNLTGAAWRHQLNRITSKVNILLLRNYIKEKHFHFDNSILYHSQASLYLDGYWQSPQYFSPINNVIKKDFTFRTDVTPLSKNLENDILYKESVCLHIRRGDYLQNSMHYVDPTNYILDAVAYMQKTIGNDMHLFVFSDDLQWCKAHLPSLIAHQNITYCQTESANDDFQLMTYCKHFIIANSTFSWWAAFLGNNEHKLVIAPRNWFSDTRIVVTDLYPFNWIKL
jgi:hypothetical protein